METKLTKRIPYFLLSTVRDSFADKIKDDLTVDDKIRLNGEYLVAIEEEKKRIDIEGKAIAEQNTNAFFSNPSAVIEELEVEAGQCFSLGEMLICRGIAIVSSKRFGKGVHVGKGTIAEGTCSNFRVTVKIGDKTFIDEVGAYNDKRSREGAESCVAASFARELALGLS